MGPLIGVCLLVGAAVSWWLGWWSIATDKKKMNKDIDVAKHKLADGVHNLKGSGSDRQNALTVEQPMEATFTVLKVGDRSVMKFPVEKR